MNFKTWFNASCDRNCVALITGASSGIGYKYLSAIASLGCKCIASSVDGPELANAAETVRRTFGVEVLEIVADLSKEAGIDIILQACAGHDIAILVNNAGFGIKGAFVETSPQRYHDILHVNAIAPTLLCRHILPQMIDARRGLVLHVSSINAFSPIAYNAVYTATKAYLLYYAYAVSHELKDSNILFQIVLPSTTNTLFHQRQGAVPQAMFMEPGLVVQRSLAKVDCLLSVSNKIDRILLPFVSSLPLWLRVRVATAMLHSRLALKQ